MFWVPVIVAWAGAILSWIAGRRLLGGAEILPEGDAIGRVSVIIPARNEAGSLPGLLETLWKQSHPPFEVLVVDDQSDDETADLAEAGGARVILGKPLPDGWFGKPWACHQGAEHAEGELLLFLDADTRLEPEAIGRMVAATEEGRHVVSVAPWHEVKRPYEGLSVFFNLLMVGGIGASGPLRNGVYDVGLFGQVMMISRERYDKVGGHGRVKRRVLENFHLSRFLWSQDVRCISYVGGPLVRMRMFPDGLGQMVRSWMKGFHAGAGISPKWTLVTSSLWISGLMSAFVGAAVAWLGGWQTGVAGLMAYLVTAAALWPHFRTVGGFSGVNALFYPVALLFYQVVFFTGMARSKSGGKVQWKGRDVD
jgi:4,4'-diaponeurosporenoate glycosyltransferase